VRVAHILRSVDRVCAIVVSYREPAATRAAVASLLEQTHAPQRVVVVDNDPDGRLDEIAGARVLRQAVNRGYTGGANAGARAAGDADWLFLLNPDALAAPDCVERLIEAADERTAILGAQVLLPDAEHVNAGDNPLHLTGLSWSGRFEQRREGGPAREAAVVSGAALLVRRAAWEQLGGLTERFFLYHDDVDLAWRARLSGWSVRFVPAATVRHEYTFDKGLEKWFYLERNRTWTILTLYGGRTLLVLAPLLLASEAAILLAAARQGWLREKLRAWVAVIRWLPALLARRRELQVARQATDAELLALQTARVETPVLRGGLVARANPWMERYGALVTRALR
jgi:GT2 family glycosyltransferase